MLEELVSPSGNEAFLEEKVLSRRQREILKVVATLGYKGDYRYHAGVVLGIAYNTVQNCSGEILKRLKAHDIFAAVLKAFQLRLLSVDEIDTEDLSELKLKLEELSPVEKKVLQAFYDCAMEKGYANQVSVAPKLNTTEFIVRNTLHSTYLRLRVHNRAQLAVVAHVYITATSGSV